MPFWTMFWLVVPPIILFGTVLLYFYSTRKDEE